MSIHRSLKVSRGTGGQRNVWTRMERIVALKKQGRYEEGKALGLPKVRTRFKTKSKKKAAPDEAAAATPAAAAAAAPAAAPAAGKDAKKK